MAKACPDTPSPHPRYRPDTSRDRKPARPARADLAEIELIERLRTAVVGRCSSFPSGPIDPISIASPKFCAASRQVSGFCAAVHASPRLSLVEAPDIGRRHRPVRRWRHRCGGVFCMLGRCRSGGPSAFGTPIERMNSPCRSVAALAGWWACAVSSRRAGPRRPSPRRSRRTTRNACLAAALDLHARASRERSSWNKRPPQPIMAASVPTWRLNLGAAHRRGSVSGVSVMCPFVCRGDCTHAASNT